MTSINTSLSKKIFNATVIVTSLGYLVDFYDFMIFNVVRIPSLSDLNLHGDELTKVGLNIANWQFFGLLIGSWLWGVLGDRCGRKSCLFTAILMYSLASLYCGFVQTVNQYAIARFVAGLGIAGELGVGITLISEKMTPERRGYGITLFIILGFFGVLTAAFSVEQLTWRKAYIIGGCAGLLLLLMRAFVFESGMYENIAIKVKERGGLKSIFCNRELLRKYLASIFMIVPAVFIPQIIWTLSPELAQAQGVLIPVKASYTLTIGYVCVIFGDIIACILSEKLRSRKKSILICYIVGVIFFLKYIFLPTSQTFWFFFINGALGFTFGVWVIGVVSAAEQVGTNIRSTVATTVPNFARALAIPMNLLFGQLKLYSGSITAVGIIGALVFISAFWGWRNIDETYGKDLNYEQK